MQRKLIHLPADTRPILTVVIHTEEEFDWGKPYDRRATGVEHMRHIERAQAIFDEYGIVPNYVIDYPIASQDIAIRPLKAFADSGRALIGAHLHPWVSPPFGEEVNVRNSYPCNLPRALEADKLGRLTEKIAESFGASPLTYLAGRYGFGSNTGRILEDLGYQVDISPAVPIDFSADGGPDYSAYSSDPYWFGEKRKLLGLPGTRWLRGLAAGRRHFALQGGNQPRACDASRVGGRVRSAQGGRAHSLIPRGLQRAGDAAADAHACCATACGCSCSASTLLP